MSFGQKDCKMGTQGFLNVAGGADRTVGVHSIVIAIDEASNQTGGLNYSPPQNIYESMIVYNQSAQHLLRVIITFQDQISPVTDLSFLVMPNGVYSVGFDGPVIQQVQFIYVKPPPGPIIQADYDLFTATLAGMHRAVATFVDT